jgi:hypothetical protein
MEKCRNISIGNVPTNDHYTTMEDNEGKTLKVLLLAIKGIDNIAFNPSRKQLNVMVPAHHMPYVTNSIKDTLKSASFSNFKPTLVKRLNPAGSLGSSSGTSKYSAAMSKYQTTRSPNASVDTSKGDVSKLSGQTGFSWGSQKRIPKIIDFTDATEFPQLSANVNTNNKQLENPIESPGNDGSITDTTIIQQAIDSALKKAYDEHKREIESLQKQFSKQLELIKQSQNMTTLENKFDEKFEKLMNMMMMMNSANSIENPSPLRKKGKPTNLDERFSQTKTPTRSNKTDTNENVPQANNFDSLPEEDMTELDSSHHVIGPKFDECPEYEIMKRHRMETNKMDISCETESSNDEGDWITHKEKKDKKEKLTARDNPYTNKQNSQNGKSMTQQKISDLIGQTHGTPPRTGRGGYGKGSRETPPRTGRGINAPRPIQAEKSTGTKVILSTLSSSRSDQPASREREH